MNLTPREKDKLLIAMAAIPRGGTVTIRAEGDSFTARAEGDRAKIPEPQGQVLAGTADFAAMDARMVQPYYTKLLAQSAGLAQTMALDGDNAVLVKAAA